MPGVTFTAVAACRPVGVTMWHGHCPYVPATLRALEMSTQNQRTAAVIDFVFGNDGRAAAGTGYSAEARRIAGQEAKSDIEVDDLISEALCAIVRNINSRPDEPMPDNMGGYFRTVCRNRKIDLFRARRSVDPGADDWGGNERLDVLADAATEPRGDELAGTLDLLRSTVERLGSDPVTTSGVLTWFTLEADDAVAYGDAPAPRRGVSVDQRLGWPALWFATQDRALFAATAGGARRRQRAIGKIADLHALARAHVIAAVAS